MKLKVPKVIVNFLRANESMKLFEDNCLAEAKRLGLEEIITKILGHSAFFSI